MGEEEVSLRYLYDEIANLDIEDIKVKVKRDGKNPVSYTHLTLPTTPYV